MGKKNSFFSLCHENHNLSGHIYVSLYCLKSQNTKVSMVIFVATFLPQNDKNLRGTIFYYNSFPFTIKKEPMPVRKNGRQRGAVSRAPLLSDATKTRASSQSKSGFVWPRVQWAGRQPGVCTKVDTPQMRERCEL
jgi:hypothetical protein